MIDPSGYVSARPTMERILPAGSRPWLVSSAPMERPRTVDPQDVVDFCLECQRKKCNNCMRAAENRMGVVSVTETAPEQMTLFNEVRKK